MTLLSGETKSLKIEEKYHLPGIFLNIQDDFPHLKLQMRYKLPLSLILIQFHYTTTALSSRTL